MPLSQEEASTQLAEAETAARRSARAYGYHQASPMLLLWGTIWVLGYAGTDLLPYQGGKIWLSLSLAGALITFLLVRRMGPPQRTDNRKGLKILGLIAVFLIFLFSAYAILGPLTKAQYIAFPALLVGTAYIGLGFWMGQRMIVTGLTIFLLALGGYLAQIPYYGVFMGVLGGGALILAGLWFRRV